MAMALTAESDWRAKLKRAKRGCLVVIDNKTSFPLQRIAYSTITGTWAKEPPIFVPPFSRIEFGSEGPSGMKGTEASVNYKVDGVDGDVCLSWRNPMMLNQHMFCYVPHSFVLSQSQTRARCMEIQFVITER